MKKREKRTFRMQPFHIHDTVPLKCQLLCKHNYFQVNFPQTKCTEQTHSYHTHYIIGYFMRQKPLPFVQCKFRVTFLMWQRAVPKSYITHNSSNIHKTTSSIQSFSLAGKGQLLADDLRYSFSEKQRKYYDWWNTI